MVGRRHGRRAHRPRPPAGGPPGWVVLEADRTGRRPKPATPTAKVTSQHGLIYRKLIRTFGWAKAAHYAQANQEAIRAYRDIIQAEGIDCGWEEKRAYVYGG